jgi:hypothetical protein
MKRWNLGRTALVLGGAALLGACAADDQSPLAIEGPEVQQDLFARYVALGNSITAGIQSGGISDSTQMLAYPNLVAQQAGAPFVLPLLRDPGCPAPFVDPLGQGGRVGGATAADCGLRVQPTRPIQNLAVPGARFADAINQYADPNPASSFNRIQTIILGGRSQVQAAVQAEPSLVSIWLGNNEVLAPARSGQLALLPTEAQFTQLVDQLVGAIRPIPTLRTAVMIGVVNTGVVPLLQPGAYYWLSRDAQGRFLGKPVNLNCSPFTALGQPNPTSQNLVSLEMAGNPAFPEINCADDAYPVADPRRGTFVLSLAEQATLTARVAAFNDAIRTRAEANGWIFIDPNVALVQLGNQRDAQGRYQNLRKCQALPAALQTGSPAAVQTALVTSCPVPAVGPTAPFAAPNFFGRLISFDGSHPATFAHQQVANLIIDALNARFQLQIPHVPA